ncbi:MAG: DUF2061 domain-containing protein [Planctomycetota bacterium]
MDTRRRAWAKSLSWRILGIVILGAITYLVTGNWKATGGITIFFHSLRLVLYYWHERLWERITWGRLRHPLSHIPVRADLTAEDYELIEGILAERRYLAEQPEYHI